MLTFLHKLHKSLVPALNDANDDVEDWHFVRCFYRKGAGAGREMLPESSSPHCPFAGWRMECRCPLFAPATTVISGSFRAPQHLGPFAFKDVWQDSSHVWSNFTFTVHLWQFIERGSNVLSAVLSTLPWFTFPICLSQTALSWGLKEERCLVIPHPCI